MLLARRSVLALGLGLAAGARAAAHKAAQRLCSAACHADQRVRRHIADHARHIVLDVPAQVVRQPLQVARKIDSAVNAHWRALAAQRGLVRGLACW